MDSYQNNKERLQRILKKYVNGTATEEEIRFLDQWDSYFDRNKNVFNELTEEEQINIGFAIRQRLDTKLKSKPVMRISWVKYAAAIVLFISISLGLYYYLDQPTVHNPELHSKFGGDVLPGGNKAFVTLSDGSQYELNEAQTGITIDKDGIAYENGSQIANTDKVVTATIHVPRAGTYRITLTDGTKVILNSESSLHYPTNFTGPERKVKLEGEGYFEVAHNPNQPFIVATREQNLKVLGTHFNIQAYPGEKITSTLVEGSVELSASNRKIKLSPGEQSTLENNSFKVSEVPVNEFTAWTRNQFYYNLVPLREIFKQMERWYDVDIEYPAELGEEKYFMKIPKDRKLSEVLSSISTLTNIKFTIEGRRVMVRQ